MILSRFLSKEHHHSFFNNKWCDFWLWISCVNVTEVLKKNFIGIFVGYSYSMQTLWCLKQKGDECAVLFVQPGMTSDIISLLCVTRVSPHQLLNQYFVVIHNFLSIIHGNVCVVYLIVLLTIKSNFPKILKDAN